MLKFLEEVRILAKLEFRIYPNWKKAHCTGWNTSRLTLLYLLQHIQVVKPWGIP